MDSPRKTLEANGGQEASEDLSISDTSTTAEDGAGDGDFLMRQTHMTDQRFVPAQANVDAEPAWMAKFSEDAVAADTFALVGNFAASENSLAAGDNINVATETTFIPKIAARDQVLITAQPNVATDNPTTEATSAQARSFIIPQTPEAVRNLTVTTVPQSAEASLTQKINIDFIAANAKNTIRHKKCSAARTSIATAKADTAGGPPVVAGGNESPAVARGTVADKEPVAGTATTTAAPVAAQPPVSAAGNVLSPIRVEPNVPTVIQSLTRDTGRSFLLDEASMDTSSSIAVAALVIGDLLSTAADSVTVGNPVKTELSVTAGGFVLACDSAVPRSVAAPPAEATAATAAPEATAVAPQALFRAPEAPVHAPEAPVDAPEASTTANASAAGAGSAAADDSMNGEDNNHETAPPMYDPRSDPLVNFLNGMIMVRYGDCLFVGKLKGFSKTHIIITKAAFYVNKTHLGNLTNHKLERRFIWKITCARPPYKITYPRINPQ